MSDTVIRAEGLGKRYRRGLTGPPETLRDALTRVIKSPLAAMRRPSQEYFWALRDVGLLIHFGGLALKRLQSPSRLLSKRWVRGDAPSPATFCQKLPT